MECSMQAAPKRHGMQGTSFIADAYRKGYQIPDIPYQQFGIIAKQLWVRHPSILRLIPGYDEQTGELYPQNINADSYSEEEQLNHYLSNTFYMCKTMTGFGSNKQGLIIDLPPGSRDRDMFSQSPIDYFHWAVSSAVKNTSGRARFKALPEWSEWVNTQNGGSLPYPKVSLLFQALAYEVNGRGFLGANNQPLVDEQGSSKPLYCLLVMPHKASWTALMKALVQPQDPSRPLDPSTNNKYGALAEAQGNLLYLNPAPQPGEARKFHLRPSVQSADKRGWNKQPLNLPEDLCKNLWVPWNKLLRFYSATEQLQLLAAQFGADTVNYIFEGNPEFSGIIIPDEIRAAGKGRYDTSQIRAKVSSAPAQTRSPLAGVGRAQISEPTPYKQEQAQPPSRSTDGILHKDTTHTSSSYNSTLARIRNLKAQQSQPAASGRTNADLANQLMAELDDQD